MRHPSLNRPQPVHPGYYHGGNSQSQNPSHYAIQASQSQQRNNNPKPPIQNPPSSTPNQLFQQVNHSSVNDSASTPIHPPTNSSDVFFRRAQSSIKATHVSDAANAKPSHPKHELSLPPLNQPKFSHLIKDLYCFLFMNISRLLTKTKSKTKFIHDFTITRCDRRLRMGGGVCMYVKNSFNFTTCVSYSNSTNCELLIVRLHDPSL